MLLLLLLLLLMLMLMLMLMPASGRHYRGERGATPHAHPTSSLH
ncbi:hypothetical protein [Stenotrophomonas maltophilia]